jgi:hypothetical protein
MGLEVALIALALQGGDLFEIPRHFWGEYNDRLANCGAEYDESTLRISWDRVEFYASTGELRGLIRNPDGSVVIIAEHQGEGEKWQSVYQLRMTPDRSQLVVVHPQALDVEQIQSSRLRCP